METDFGEKMEIRKDGILLKTEVAECKTGALSKDREESLSTKADECKEDIIQ